MADVFNRNKTSDLTVTGANAPKKTVACLACSRHKVRCIVDHGHSSCRRCAKRGIQCVIRKPNVAVTDKVQATDFELAVVKDLQYLRETLNQVLAQNSLPGLEPLRSLRVLSDLPDLQNTQGGAVNPDDTEKPVIVQDLAPDSLDAGRGSPTADEQLSNAPISSLYEITRLRSLRTQVLQESVQDSTSKLENHDIIARRLLSHGDAAALVHKYLSKTDHYIYGICSKYKSLDEVRKSSSLLLVAICTVTASQEPHACSIYKICHRELRRLVADLVFNPHATLEDFRGLCIASVWLSDISWPVSGLAIRRAAEADLPSSLQHFLQLNSNAPTPSSRSSQTSSDLLAQQVRLWYLLYICDQHLSILHGRTPIIQGDGMVQNWEAFYTAMGDFVNDARICSQVAMLQILSAVSTLCGREKDAPMPLGLKSQLEQFNDQLDDWVTLWINRSRPHPIIYEYPAKAVMLHFHFSKLYVSSQVFRGLSSGLNIEPVPSDFIDLALVAVESAKSVIDLVTTDKDITDAFAGVPYYFHTMIAYACSFLLKTTRRYSENLSIDDSGVYDMIWRIIELCEHTPCTSFHLVHWIGQGLRKMLADVGVTDRKRIDGGPPTGGNQWSSSSSASMNTTLEVPPEASQTGGGAFDTQQDISSMTDILSEDHGDIDWEMFDPLSGGAFSWSNVRYFDPL